MDLLLQFVFHRQKGIRFSGHGMVIGVNVSAQHVEASGKFPNLSAALDEHELPVCTHQNRADAQGARHPFGTKLRFDVLNMLVAVEQLFVTSQSQI